MDCFTPDRVDDYVCWQDQISRAREDCIDYWIDRHREADTNPEVKKCQFWLGALDPDRFRERKDQLQGGIVVQILQSPDGRMIDSKVISSGKALPGKPLELKEVDVDVPKSGLVVGSDCMIDA